MPLPFPREVDTLKSLASKYGTPLQIYDEAGIRTNAQKLIKSFKVSFPSFTEYFAVKALPNPAVCQILLDEGCGLDCSSTSELHLAASLGVPGEKVIFTSNYTSAEDLGIAFDQGVIINLDDISLIKTLVEVRGRVPDLMCFRLNPGLGRTDSSTVSNVLGGPTAKFGIPPDQILEAYKQAQAAGATRFGIHMMTGSCVMNTEYWAETASVLFKTMSDIKKELGITMEFMNIGGGIGIPYHMDEDPVDVPAIVQTLDSVFSEAATRYEMKLPALSMENGRYMTGPFGWLVSKVAAIKRTSYGTYYGLDACMAHLMRPGMYDAYHHIDVPTVASSDKTHRANVVGNLCENNDWFAKDREVAADTDVGDLMVIYDTGAHSHSMGFQYNGKLRAPEVLLLKDGKSEALIRSRETIESLYANCINPSS